MYCTYINHCGLLTNYEFNQMLEREVMYGVRTAAVCIRLAGETGRYHCELMPEHSNVG